MKSRFLALASAALVSPRSRRPRRRRGDPVVISQVAFRGPGGGNDEVIEIRNISAATSGHRRLAALGLQQHRHARARARRPGGHHAARGQDVRVRQHGRARSRRAAT